uniref:Uncharacterized protein n=1 Tax=Lactuca sativa TaxID=4236 RepID=A0A9R1WWM9_LACSA|nr:hypothetical protein LSAT_V11C800420310 [Lactuca sativa]
MYFWTYTLGLMQGMFEKIEKFRIFKQTNPKSKKVHKYTIVGFTLPFKHDTYLFSIDMDFGDVPRGNLVLYTNADRIPTDERNNQPISVVANPTELMMLFYLRYVNWTLTHEESPPTTT